MVNVFLSLSLSLSEKDFPKESLRLLDRGTMYVQTRGLANQTSTHIHTHAYT